MSPVRSNRKENERVILSGQKALSDLSRAQQLLSNPEELEACMIQVQSSLRVLNLELRRVQYGIPYRIGFGFPEFVKDFCTEVPENITNPALLQQYLLNARLKVQDIIQRLESIS